MIQDYLLHKTCVHQTVITYVFTHMHVYAMFNLSCYFNFTTELRISTFPDITCLSKTFSSIHKYGALDFVTINSLMSRSENIYRFKFVCEYVATMYKQFEQKLLLQAGTLIPSFFVIGTTLYIYMSALPFGQVYPLLLTRNTTLFTVLCRHEHSEKALEHFYIL